MNFWSRERVTNKDTYYTGTWIDTFGLWVRNRVLRRGKMTIKVRHIG